METLGENVVINFPEEKTSDEDISTMIAETLDALNEARQKSGASESEFYLEVSSKSWRNSPLLLTKAYLKTGRDKVGHPIRIAKKKGLPLAPQRN